MATKFVSPFISDETEGEVAAEGDLTIPDAVLFDDSLDEGVDPTALLDDADLPTDCAATAEPKLGNLSQTAELNDSLCDAEDLDKTQLPASDGDLLAQPTLEAEANTQLKTVSTPPQATDGNKEHSKSSGLVETKAKAANLEGKAVAASTVESQVSKGAAKVKPSFGKKKKGFTPPKVTAKAATTTSQSENKKLTEKSSDQSSSNASDKTPPQSSSPDKGASSFKQHPQSNKDGDVKATSEKVPSTDTKKVKAVDKKMTVEEKKREKEKKEQERALKKQVLEQKKLDRENKKAELERQRNEKRLELERKKAEREQKKMEKELKKMEREQKKAEKQAKASQKQKTKDMEAEDTSSSDDKKCETGSEKVVEGRSHDIEYEQKEDEGVDKTDSVVKSGQQLNIEEKENIPPNVKQSCDISTKDAAATLSPIASCADETKTQNVKFSPQKKGHDQQKTLEANIKEQELNEKQSNDACLESEELAKDTTPAAEKENTEMACGDRGTKNQKMKKAKKFSPPKAKKDAASKTAAKDVKKQKKVVIKMNKVGNFSGGAARNDENKTLAGAGGKTKKRKPSVYSDSEDELEPKKAKSVNNIGSVWVQCENTNCKKWRLLRDCDDPAKLPGKWVCSMNTDPDRNRCSAEEEQWSDLGDSQEFVESPFIPGSLVWSKMEGYPWWPAMIEEDPNKETYYEMKHRDSPIPVRYHVVFFDIPVSRGWVSSLHTLPYTGQNNPNKDGNVSIPQRLRRTLTEGKKQANKALDLSVKERVETLSFAKRFRGRRRKRQAEESPEALPSQAKYRKTTSNGERKSARIRVSVEESELEGLDGEIPVVRLKPSQNQQSDSEAVITEGSGDDSIGIVQQHEE